MRFCRFRELPIEGFLYQLNRLGDNSTHRERYEPAPQIISVRFSELDDPTLTTEYTTIQHNPIDHALRKPQYAARQDPQKRGARTQSPNAGWFPASWRSMGTMRLLSSHSPSVIKPSQAMRAADRDPAGGKDPWS